MEFRNERDFLSIHDEKFDFNLSASSASSKSDDDEGFLGPVSHEDVSVAEEQDTGPVNWSPLSGDQLEAMCQEAHRIANQLQHQALHKDMDTVAVNTGNHVATSHKQFVQGSDAEVHILSQSAVALSPIKQHTVCEQDAPKKQLAFNNHQQRLKRSSSNNISLSTNQKVRLSTTGPLVSPVTKPSPALPRKAVLGVGLGLARKPAAPTALCSTMKNRPDKTKLQPPTKVKGILRQSSLTHSTIRTESSEDVFSDCETAEVSVLSLNSSLLGKRTAVATKSKASVGARKPSVGNVWALQTKRHPEGGKTSSSSSSVSSNNSSLSLSPTKTKLTGKLNSAVKQRISSYSGRPVNERRSAYSAFSDAGRRRLSSHCQTQAEAMHVQATRSTTVKKAETTPLQTERSGSGRPLNTAKDRQKPEDLFFPTPKTPIKGSYHADDFLKRKNLMSKSSIESLPQKPLGPPTQSVSSCKQRTPRRPSCLPTPVKRRTSAVPQPCSQTRLSNSCITSTPVLSGKAERCRSLLKATEEDETLHSPDIKPLNLEEDLPGISPTNIESNESENKDLEQPALNVFVPNIDMVESEPREENTDKNKEVLLLDLPAPLLPAEEKPLIDLSNTPDLIRSTSKSSKTTQLIDLSSPLIKWSPVAKNKNNSPLINLSF